MFAFTRRFAVVAAAIAALTVSAVPSLQGARATGSDEVRYAAIVVDANSGEVLFARRADSQRYPASITKVMTLYLVFEAMADGRVSPDDYITISPRAASQPPSKLGLPAGSRITVDNAIRALAVRSANDIAVALAEHVGGSEARFAALMTLRAQELGMTQTRYVNPHGLPDSRQISTARDIAVLSRAVMRDFPQYYSYFGQRHWNFDGRTYNNTNGLLHSMPGVDGIKTGYTNASGYNLAASAVRDGRRLITIVLGGRTSQTRNAHVAELINTGFEVERRRAAGEDIQVAQTLFEMGVGATTYAAADVPVSPEVLAASARADQAAELTAALNGAAGDLPAQAAAAPAAAPRPAAPPPAAPAPRRDPDAVWTVQVGAFREQNVAQTWLADVGRRFRDHFRDAEGAVSAAANGWYRARYQGLTRSAADAACAALTERRVPCLVIRAD